MASRRANAARTRPVSFNSSSRFNLSDFSHSDVNRALFGNDVDLDVLNFVNRGCSLGTPQLGTYSSQRHSLPNLGYPVPFGSGAPLHESDLQTLRGGFPDSPPDLSTSVTPVEREFSRLDDLLNIPENWNQANYDQFLAMGGGSDLSTAFDMANILDFLGPQQILPVTNEFIEPAQKGYSLSCSSTQTARTSPMTENSSPCRGGPAKRSFSTGSLQHSESSDASDGLLASQESWPFFSCNRSPKSGCFPPATAALYVQGLIRVLTTHDWQIPGVTQHENVSTEVYQLLRGEGMIDRPVSYSTEMLNAATQAILHKACKTHRTEPGSTDALSQILNDKADHGAIQLPPIDDVARLLESYISHHRPYYACAADLTRSNVPMLQSNVPASSLLMLLTIAQGAAFISMPTARYLASGLIEACRLFLFESIEKDILLSRDPTVLHSALLFTTAGAWSGDNWHMDIAMGQRGMYLSMMSHARMFDGDESRTIEDELRHNPTKAWEDWRISEEKRRIAYSWVIVDQELSLFSDTAPLLNVVNLQAPMPSSERLWAAQAADEWIVRSGEVIKDRTSDSLSLRDLFTCFVEGELSNSETNLSALQLRLLLHPLQTLVCQLRQFLTCLPDSGRQSLGTSISKVAIKARLEEISTLLRQWYAFTERHIDADGNTCLTTRANLIMYHLISLNTKTSLGFIEQFARGEIECGGARHASQWLQTHCIEDAEEVNFHCGQILRLIKSIPNNLRPPWWSGAVYRAALIAWATSMAGMGGRTPIDNALEVDKPFAIDSLSPEHSSVEQYLRYREGVPMLSKRDGTLISMNDPSNVLQYCISLLEDDLSMRANEGVMGKLQSLANRWRNSPYTAKS